MGKIMLGTAGNIASDILSSLKKIKELGLDGQEIEFVRGVTMGQDTAKKAGELAKELDLRLSVHAPYYINLLSEEKPKIYASKHRILESCKRGHFFSHGKHKTKIVFHPAYYGKLDKEKAYQDVKKEILDMMQTIKKEGLNIKLAPETTGKGSQFGDIDELLRLRKETGCSICVDFAHIYARNIGQIDYKEIFDKLEKANIKNLHCHFAGIEYGSKGERNHIQMSKDFAMPLISQAKKRDINLMIINESPDILKGALELKELVQN